MENNFVKISSKIMAIVLSIILIMPFNVLAASVDGLDYEEKVKVSSTKNGEGLEVTADFLDNYRLNPTENFSVCVLDTEENVVVDGTPISFEKADMIFTTEDNKLSFNISSNSYEDFLVQFENNTYTLIFNINTKNNSANLFEIKTDLVAGELDYEIAKEKSLFSTYSNILVEYGAPSYDVEGAMKAILTSDFNFTDEINEASIKDQVDQKLAGSGLTTEVKYDNNLKYYTLTISDGTKTISKPLYINSEVSNIFVYQDLLDYSEIRKTDSANINIEDNILKVNATQGQTYSNIVLPIWNYGRNYTIEADLAHNGGVNVGRWAAISYGVKKVEDPDKYTFWQMAMRKSTSDNGVEIANMQPDQKWSVNDKNGYKEDFKDNTFYHLTIVVEDGEVREYINGELILKGPALNNLDPDGRVAITYDRSNFEVKNLKVSGNIPGDLAKDFPLEVNNYVSDLYIPNTKISVPPVVVSNGEPIDTVSNSAKRPQALVLNLSDNNKVLDNGGAITISEALNKLNKKAIPAFYVDTMEKANYLLNYIEDNNLVDVFVISKDENILKVFSTGEGKYLSKTGVYTVLDLSDEKVSDNLIDAVYRTNRSNSRIVILNEDEVTFDNIKYIQSRALVTWVKSSEDTRKLYDNILSGTYGIVTENYNKAIDAIESFDESISDTVLTRVPVDVAHRAFHYEIPFDMEGFKAGEKMPENTIGAVKAAIAAHADAVENDIHLTRDGVLVVNHDNTTGRLSEKNVEIANTDLSELQSFKFKEGTDEVIPTLRDYINETKDLDKDLVYVIELKSADPRTVPALKTVLEETGVKDRVVLISFNEPLLTLSRQIMPELSVGILNGKVTGATDVNQAVRKLSEALDRDNAFYNMHYLAQNYKQLQQEIARGILFHPWTVNDNRLFQDEYLEGYHGITSNTFYQAKDFLTKVESENENLKNIDDAKITSTYRNKNVETEKTPVSIKTVDNNNDPFYIASDVYTLPDTGKKFAMYSRTFKIEEEKTYKVEFIVDEEKATVTGEKNIENVKEGTEVSTIEPKVEPKEGYKFIGWDPELTGVVDSDKTFTAKFEKIEEEKTYKVEFVVDEEKATVTGEKNLENVKEGTEISTIEPKVEAKEGYKFLGWDPELTGVVDSDKTFTAKFEEIEEPEITYTVEFIVDNTKGEVSGETIIKDLKEGTDISTIKVPTVIAKEGYEFIGWDQELVGLLLSDKVFTAEFKKSEEPKPTETEETEVEKVSIPFKTKYEDDSTLEKGKTRVKQEGIDGEKEITKTYKVIDGKRQENPTITEKIIKSPVDKIILVGTKVVDQEEPIRPTPLEPSIPVEPEEPIRPTPLEPSIPVEPRPEYPSPIRPDNNRRYNPFVSGFFFGNGNISNEVKPVDTKPVEPKNIEITDISGHWAEKPVREVVNKGYMELDNGKFFPNVDATRLGYVKALAKLAKVNPKDYMNKTVFKDVKSGTTDAGYINWANEKGIIKGTGEGDFEGDRNITRQEIATILNRYEKAMNLNLSKKDTVDFSDNDKIADWAKEDVKEAHEKGIFNGKDNNMFDPLANITRAEVAQVVVNMDK